MQTSISSDNWGCMVIRLTPKGFLVRAWVPSISRASSSGDIDPQAITPKPPAFEIAATRLRSETHDIAPPRMAVSVPRNSRPRRHKCSRRALAVLMLLSPASVVAVFISVGIEAVGAMQGTDGQLGV